MVPNVAAEAWVLMADRSYSRIPKSSSLHSREQERVLAEDLHGPSEHMHGHDVVAGHGRTPPAIPRLSPRLATLAEVVLGGKACDG